MVLRREKGVYCIAEAPDQLSNDPLRDFDEKMADVEFAMGMSSISILRSISYMMVRS